MDSIKAIEILFNVRQCLIDEADPEEAGDVIEALEIAIDALNEKLKGENDEKVK